MTGATGFIGRRWSPVFFREAIPLFPLHEMSIALNNVVVPGGQLRRLWSDCRFQAKLERGLEMRC